MTTANHTVSFKLPERDLRRIPSKNRSEFFRAAVAEKLSRQTQEKWKPKTALGRKLAALRAAHVASGARLLSSDELAEELRQRRGGLA